MINNMFGLSSNYSDLYNNLSSKADNIIQSNKAKNGIPAKDVYGRTLLPELDYKDSSKFSNKNLYSDLKNSIIYSDTVGLENNGIMNMGRW